MKWPNSLTVVRHGQSVYNQLKDQKENDPLYVAFREAYDNRHQDPGTAKLLAGQLLVRGFALGFGDHDTPLTPTGEQQAEATGRQLRNIIELPDIIFASPYKRTVQTLGHMAVGWPELANVKYIEEERIREQEHGLALVYSDWRIMNVMHPEQEALHDLQGPYWYRYPQGENVPDVRERDRSMTNTITRDYAGQNVLMVSHHLSILCRRANQERLDEHGFRDLDVNHKPINCGVTIYRGNADVGQNGRLELDIYNQQLY